MDATEQESKKVDQGDEDGEVMAMQTFSWYLRPEATFKVISTEWSKFTLLSGVIYSIHLVFLCAGVDKYTSYERHLACTDAPSGANSSAVFDLWILLVVIFHLVEWLRQTIFMTSALVGVNLVPVYYIMSLIIPYGFIILFAAGAVGFSADSDCQEKQPGRANYLKLQFLAVALLIPTCAGHVLFFKIKGTEWVHEIYNKEDGDDEEDD